jgi:hypothetical protein
LFSLIRKDPEWIRVLLIRCVDLLRVRMPVVDGKRRKCFTRAESVGDVGQDEPVRPGDCRMVDGCAAADHEFSRSFRQLQGRLHGGGLTDPGQNRMSGATEYNGRVVGLKPVLHLKGGPATDQQVLPTRVLAKMLDVSR